MYAIRSYYVIQTNIVGTFRLLEAVRAYWSELEGEAKTGFRFLHVSTDESYNFV